MDSCPKGTLTLRRAELAFCLPDFGENEAFVFSQKTKDVHVFRVPQRVEQERECRESGDRDIREGRRSTIDGTNSVTDPYGQDDDGLVGEYAERGCERDIDWRITVGMITDGMKTDDNEMAINSLDDNCHNA